MSHIRTAPRAGRAGFDAVPQSHYRNGNSGDYDGLDEYDNRRTQGSDRQYTGEHYAAPIGLSTEDESPPEYHSNRSRSSSRMDYSQMSVSTAYKPDMVIYNEIPIDAPLVMNGERPNYKPSALRWPFLTTLLFVILALVGLLAWALHVLPVFDNDLDIMGALDARDIRAPILRTATLVDLDNASHFTTDSIVGRAVTTELTQPTSQPTSQPVETLSPDEDDFGNIGTQTVTNPGPSTTPAAHTTKPADGGTPVSTTEPAWSKPEGDFGNVGGTVTVSESATSRPKPTIASSKGSEDYGNVGGTVTVSESTVSRPKPTIASSKGSEDYGNVGSKTVSDDITATVPSSDHGNVGTITVSETTTSQTPQTPTFVTPAIAITTDSQGITITSTSIPPPVSTPQTVTLTNSEGQPTATQETQVLVTPSISVQTDSHGAPTATATFYPSLPSNKDTDGNSKNNSNIKVYTISYGSYFIGMFLPTLISILLAIPIRILDVNAKILQPWHELTHSRGGAPGRESLCLETSGWQSVISSMRSLAGGQALVFLTSILVLISALLIPLSAEAVAFDLKGAGCVEGSGSAKNCAYVLAVFDQAAKATVVLLGIMGVATLAIIALLVRWRSGVSTNPWSICGTASLALNPDVRRLFTSLPAGSDMGRMPKGLLESVLEDRWFKLDYFQGVNGTIEYGVMLREDTGRVPGQIGGEEKEPQDHHAAPTEAKHHLPFLMLGYAGRLVFLFVLCGLLALILYYNNTGGDTAFERFMDSESFGVRFLFTGVGVVISFFWASFFSSIAILSPYQLLASSPQQARRSILLAPPTNAFSGLWSAIRRRHSFLAVVAVTSILSEFLTIFLSNVPFRVTQTFIVHNICTWAAIGILCIMVLVVVGSFFIKWPHMPVDPSTIAGAMYYVCDSWMLARFEGLSAMKRRDRDWHVNETNLKYEYGEIRGASGIVRIGVDASTSGGTVWA
ncbi:hypothetical protein F4805DRAFT_226957 [Annulohypoxylon moriforme]|nr:hypothetical protein F4805DRAFT_226957 [Annulohypoxylon moriforme]